MPYLPDREYIQYTLEPSGVYGIYALAQRAYIQIRSLVLRTRE